MAHTQNTTPQLTPNRNSCIGSMLLQRSFENLAKLLIRKTLTIGTKVLSPFSLSDQFLTHASLLMSHPQSTYTVYTPVKGLSSLFLHLFLFIFKVWYICHIPAVL